MDITIFFGFFIVFLLLSIILGNYLYRIIDFQDQVSNRVFGPIERIIYKLINTDGQSMNAKQYFLTLLFVNGVLFLVGFLLLLIQGIIPVLSDNNAGNIDFGIAFHTAVSFVTNTNLQAYMPETTMTLFSQTVVLPMFLFTSAATGLAVCAAFIRGITGKLQDGKLGNFFVDFTRVLIRFLIPLSLIAAVLLLIGGLPQNFTGNQTIETLSGATQVIQTGPIASFEAIKQIGTNGGGFFGANSAHPFENPTAWTNMLEMLLMMVGPASCLIVFGKMVRNRKQTIVLFSVALLLFLLSFGVMYGAQLGSLLEGIEFRFGQTGTAAFMAVTTSFTTGAVNASIDSLHPLTQLMALFNMMTNVVFGGNGTGFMNLIMYVLLTVFIAGLMVGRSPEFLHKVVGPREMKYVAISILIHPLLILFPLGLYVVIGMVYPHLDFHTVTQGLYQFTSAAANNGSAMAGLTNNSSFWLSMTSLIMLAGRYISMFLLLLVSYSLAKKVTIPDTPSTFRTDTPLFGVLLFIVILVIGVLTFVPILIIGPVAQLF